VLAVSRSRRVAQDKRYKTASAMSDQEFETYIDSIIATDPLSQSEELERINASWEN